MELGARVRLTSHEVLTAVEKRRRRSRVSLSEVKLHICGAGNDGRVYNKASGRTHNGNPGLGWLRGA